MRYLAAILICLTAVRCMAAGLYIYGKSETIGRYTTDKMEEDIEANMSLWYATDYAAEVTGTVLDFTQAANNISQADAAKFPATAADGGLVFDGGNDVIQLPYDVNSNGSFTCWVYVNADTHAAGYIQFVDKTGANLWRVWYNKASDYFQTTGYNASRTLQWNLNTGASSISLQTWYFVSTTWKANEARIYLNGILKAQDTSVAFPSYTPTAALSNMGASSTPNNFLNGTLYQYKMYDMTLSSNQQWTIYLREPTAAQGGKR